MIELRVLRSGTAYYFDGDFFCALEDNVTVRYGKEGSKVLLYGGYYFPLYNGAKLVFNNQSFTIEN